jgi:Trypsin-like peptidase domain
MARTTLGAAVAARVERAVVRLPRRGGQGVLVAGGLVVTAAHCIGWTAEGAMAYGDPTPEKIEYGGRELVADVVAVEPCADIAVLGVLDGQVFPDEADAFEAWCEGTAPVRLYTEDLPPEASTPPRGMLRSMWLRHRPSIHIPAHILTHDKGWVRARVKQIRRDAKGLAIEAEERIQGGTSGGPVIASDGRLLGVISRAGETFTMRGEFEGLTPFYVPRPDRSLPVWVVSRIREGEKRLK